MKSKIFIILLISFITLITSNELLENKYYFLVSPSDKKNTPNIFYFYNLNEDMYTINSTELENMKIIGKTKSQENPIKNLSSLLKYEDKLLIKTCFAPKKIIEIIDENNEIFKPTDDYFKNIKNNLDNIKYCYSTIMMNPTNTLEEIIVTYWTEFTLSSGKEIYNHKYIIFYPNKKTFSKVYSLFTGKNNFYAQSCTNMRNIYIYCTIESSNSLANKYHFYIDSTYLTQKIVNINLIPVSSRFSNTAYNNPIGLVKSIYTNVGKQAEYFLMEYHDKTENKTRLMTSLFVKSYNMSFVLKFEDLNVYRGINIEDQYIEKNLFNHLLPNVDEIIIIYIMKGANGENLLLLNRYDYDESLKSHSNFEKYSMSNYLRDDICSNPKYMQSIYINSFINYDDKDKEIMEYNPDNYYIYQRDIGILIACEKKNGEIEYEAKKISMPQCLNVLEEINGKSGLLKFTSEKSKIILDINNEPNLKSLRNVQIEFLDSILYNRFLIIQPVKNGERSSPILGSIKLSNIDYIEITRTLNFRKGKTYKIPYRITQTGFSGISSTCHLSSDLCYLEFTYQDKEGTQIEDDDCTVKYCSVCEDKQCIQCQDIIGILLNSKDNECTCDVDNGFKKEPKIAINMCICKDNYSFYKNINRCLPDVILNSGKFCIIGQDDLSLINIYDDIKPGMTKYIKDGLPYCKGGASINKEAWFKMGEYVFNWAKIENCVYITFNNSIVMYSNRSECEFKYYNYKEYLEIDIKSEDEYNSLLDKAYEYQPDDTSNSLVIKTDNITFYILNNYTTNNFSSIRLSQKCIDIIKEENSLSSLLIFVANIKKENIISTQVEYSFYNSVPQFINQKLDLNSCYPTKSSIQLDERRLQDEEEEEENKDEEKEEKKDININIDINIGNQTYELDMDEIILNVEINWNEKQLKNIDELYNKRGINIFNSSDNFFLDVCNKFTTPEGTDMYLDDRKEKYYIDAPICETGCTQIGYDNSTNRAVCKCKIKYSPENYENVTFSPNELDERFTKNYIIPNNLRVVWSCFIEALKGNSSEKVGLLFSFFLIIIYIILLFLKYRKKQNNNNNHNDNDDDSHRNNNNLIDSNKKKKRGIKNNKSDDNNNINNDKKEKKELFRELWEEPFKKLMDLIPQDNQENNKNQNNNDINNTENKTKDDENASENDDPDFDEKLVPKEHDSIAQKINTHLVRMKNDELISNDKGSTTTNKKSSGKETNPSEGSNVLNINKKKSKSINKGKRRVKDEMEKEIKNNSSLGSDNEEEKDKKEKMIDINNEDDENNINNDPKKKEQNYNKMIENKDNSSEDEDSKYEDENKNKNKNEHQSVNIYTKKLSNLNCKKI